jgi:acetoacetyl-CoA synthetase
MMWNYLHAALLSGATIVLYDGATAYPAKDALWELAAATRIQHFGTSAPFLVYCMKEGLQPGKKYDLQHLRSIGSTGSPLPSEAFDYVYEDIHPQVWLCSMSGGTDICTAFVGSNPWWPVYAGEIQCRALGCALAAWDEGGQPLEDEVGEMVVTRPMPSMPVAFWNDPEGIKYQEAYFEHYPGVWRHGDWVRITPRQGLVILGRSDATLNRQGIRIGTAEIYRAVDQVPEIQDSLVIHLEIAGEVDFMPLFVVMKEGQVLTNAVIQATKSTLRATYTPRHVPDAILQVPAIPYTISGKKMETPIKKILLGYDEDKAVNKGSMRNPESLDFFRNYAAQWRMDAGA